MSAKSQKILVIVATVIIVLAIAAIVFVTVKPESGAKEEAQTSHPAEETFYNDDGTVNRVVRYENDVYKGQTDYYSEGLNDYVMFYDENSELIGSEMTEKNVAGKIAKFKKSEGEKTVRLDEYVYQDDFETLKKVTKKSYDAEGKETAEKLYYAEDGVTVTERFTYFEGKEQTHETFDSKNPYKPENN